MMVADVVTLIKSEEVGKNDFGQTEYREIKRDVFCLVGDVRQSEFFTAQQIGIKPSNMLVTNPINYEGEEYVEFRSRKFKVYRTYERSENEIELYIEELIR